MKLDINVLIRAKNTAKTKFLFGCFGNFTKADTLEEESPGCYLLLCSPSSSPSILIPGFLKKIFATAADVEPPWPSHPVQTDSTGCWRWSHIWLLDDQHWKPCHLWRHPKYLHHRARCSFCHLLRVQLAIPRRSCKDTGVRSKALHWYKSRGGEKDQPGEGCVKEDGEAGPKKGNDSESTCIHSAKNVLDFKWGFI